MTDLQIVDYAARYGYTWDETVSAIETLKHERDTGASDYWDRSGVGNLLEAVRACNTSRPVDADLQVNGPCKRY